MQDKILPMNVRPIDAVDKKVIIEPKLVTHLSEVLGRWQNHRETTVEHIWTRAYRNFNSEFDDTDYEIKTKASKAWRSKAFYPLTEQKVTGAQAQLQDILFKGGHFPYDIKRSPIPDDPAIASALESAANPGTAMTPQWGQEIEQKAMGIKELDVRIKNMKKRIDDQIAECDAASVGLISIFDGALYGTAFLESPKVVRKKRYRWVNKGKKFTKKEIYEDVPTVVNLSPWDCWPDPECGGYVDKGQGFFHRDAMALSDIQDLYNLVFPEQGSISEADSEEYEYMYRKDEFEMLLEEINTHQPKSQSSSNSNEPDDTKNSGVKSNVYDVYTFSGAIQNKFLKPYINDLASASDYMHSEVIVVFCKSYVIKCVINPFPGQKRPYHMVPWSKIPGSAFGRGVAQKIFDAQKNVNRLMRMYIDNKRLSGNLMTSIDKSKLRKGEGLDVYPGRNWEFDSGFGDVDVRKMFQPVFFPDVTAGVLEAIGTMVQWADQSSGVPRILEGQPGGNSSTAFAENQRITAASKQLGLVLKNYDMHAWVPIIESFYDWNMEFLKDDNIKGDFSIVATGFSTFENRHLRKLDLERLLLMSQQLPALAQKVKADPIVEDWAIAGNIDPERYLLTSEEVAAKEQAQQQEQLNIMQAQLQMEQQKQGMEHQMDAELKRMEGEISAQTRMALAQINSQSKLASDQLKSETQKLIKLADIESKENKNARGPNNRRRNPNQI